MDGTKLHELSVIEFQPIGCNTIKRSFICLRTKSSRSSLLYSLLMFLTFRIYTTEGMKIIIITCCFLAVSYIPAADGAVFWGNRRSFIP